jgi:predicted dehydrogenase
VKDPEQSIDRRRFLTTSAALLAGSAAFTTTALSYDRILGANDRISLCHIGNGSRGGDLAWIVSQLKTSQNAEINTVCDLWRLNREKAVAVNTKYYGRAPRAYQYVDDVLALKDVDAVIISTPEHSHSPT